MKDIISVMKFTMLDMVKRKSFIISTLIILVIIVVGINVPNIIDSLSEEDYKEKLLIVDSDNLFEDNLSLLTDINSDYEIIISNDSYEKIKEKIEKDEVDAAIIIEKQENGVKVRYIVETIFMDEVVPEDIIASINGLYTNIQISKLGLSEEEMLSITPNFEFTIEQTEEEEASGNVFAIMLMSIVLFFAIYYSAFQVSSSITTEKTSKIIETLVTSTSPKTIVIGKTVGIGLVGLLQMIVIVGTALITAHFCLDKELISMVLDMSNVTVYLGIVTIIYFILGYFVFAFLYALTGSTVSKPEDVQSANGPVAIIAVIGFYIAYFTMMNPTSNLNYFASLFPFSSPFCMPFRMMMGLANPTSIIISIVILALTILIIANVTIKIYSNAILNTGTKMNIKDLVKMYKAK